MTKSKPTVDQVQPGREQEIVRLFRERMETELSYDHWAYGERMGLERAWKWFNKIERQATPSPVPAEQRCPFCDHYGNVVDGVCRMLGTYVAQGGESPAQYCGCKCPVFTPPANTCGIANPGGTPCRKYKGHPGGHDLASYGPPNAGPSPESEVSEPKDDDDLHRWEIEPHPYDSSYDIMITDSDKAAVEAIQYAAEMHLWDAIEEGETRTLKVTLNNVPNIDPPESPPVPPPSTGTEELLPCDWCNHPGGYFPAEVIGFWVHIGRDNDAQICTARHPHLSIVDDRDSAESNLRTNRRISSDH